MAKTQPGKTIGNDPGVKSSLFSLFGSVETTNRHEKSLNTTVSFEANENPQNTIEDDTEAHGVTFSLEPHGPSRNRSFYQLVDKPVDKPVSSVGRSISPEVEAKPILQIIAVLSRIYDVSDAIIHKYHMTANFQFKSGKKKKYPVSLPTTGNMNPMKPLQDNSFEYEDQRSREISAFLRVALELVPLLERIAYGLKMEFQTKEPLWTISAWAVVDILRQALAFSQNHTISDDPYGNSIPVFKLVLDFIQELNLNQFDVTFPESYNYVTNSQYSSGDFPLTVFDDNFDKFQVYSETDWTAFAKRITFPNLSALALLLRKQSSIKDLTNENNDDSSTNTLHAILRYDEIKYETVSTIDLKVILETICLSAEEQLSGIQVEEEDNLLSQKKQKSRRLIPVERPPGSPKSNRNRHTEILLVAQLQRSVCQSQELLKLLHC